MGVENYSRFYQDMVDNIEAQKKKRKKKGLHLWLETDGFSVIGNCRVENCESVYWKNEMK